MNAKIKKKIILLPYKILKEQLQSHIQNTNLAGIAEM